MKTILILFISINLLLAQQTKNEELEDLSLEELMDIKIYSATKSYQRIEEIPANIIILTRKDIEKYNYTTLDELFKHIPGLFVIDDTEHFQIGSRGSLGSSFKLMINNNEISPLRIPTGASSNRNFFATPVEAIDRIEIIKGPQAVTYGANSMYGSINIITNDFNEKNIISVSKGNNGQEKVFARLNHKYEDGGVTLNTSFYQTDGISGGLENSFAQDYYINYPEAAKSLEGLLENKYKTLDLSHRYKNLTTDINYSQTNYGLYVYSTYGEGNEVEQVEKSLAFTYEDELSSNLSYKANFIMSKKNYDVDDFNILDTDYLISDNHVEDKRNQFDIHLNYNINEKMKLLLGTTYKNIEENFNQTSEILNQYQAFKYKYNESDLYSKLQYKINDKFEINAGIRFTKKDSFAISGDLINLTNNSTISIPEYYVETNKSHLPEFSAIYHINSSNHIKFLYGEANQLTYSGFDNFEEMNSSEINYIYLSKKYQINTSIFYNKSKNISLFTQEESIQDADNGTQETKGLEFAITFKPNYNFQISSSLTLQDTKAKTSSYIEIEPGFSPKTLAKIDMSYKYDRTRYSLLINYIGKMKSAIKDYDTLERYGEDSKENINLAINLEHKLSKDLSMNLHVSNLLDRDNKIPAGSTLTNFYEGAYTKGREYLFTLKYKF